MSGKGRKVKGSVFERLVAKKIIEHASGGTHQFDRKDCYRTPLSGGHEFAGASDLVISPALEQFFRFCVECKHRKNFRLEHVFDTVKDFVGYHDQVLAACEREGNRRFPMVVIRGNGGRIFAAVPGLCCSGGIVGRPDYDHLRELGAVVQYHCAGRAWVLSDLDHMLKAIFQIKQAAQPA